jgi:hypothetical protein
MNPMQEVVRQQRTPEGRAYDAYIKAIQTLGNRLGQPSSGEQLDAELVDLKRENEAILAIKDIRPGDVHVSQVLQTLSVMFANDEFIGNRLMPVVFNSGKLSGTFYKYEKRNSLGYPDDSMADRTTPAELNQSRTKATFSLTIRSLREFLDQYVIQNQDAPLNELVDLTANVLNGMAFNREVRHAAVLCTAGNFGANTVAVAAGDRWDTAGGGDPGAVIDTAKAAVWSGRGPGRWAGYMSLNVFNVLKRHPRILDTFKYGVGAAGPSQASLQMLAEYFDLDEILVGRARKDTANEGQTASYSRIWSDVFGIARVVAPSPRNAGFGFTFQDAPTQSDLSYELMDGAKGGYYARSTHADNELVVASECGYLVTTPIG